MNGDRGGLLSAGGVLSIIVGAFEVIGGAILVSVTMLGCWPLGLSLCPALPGPDVALDPNMGFLGLCAVTPLYMTILGAIFVVLGILAIAGGVSAVRRRSFSLAVAGAICTLPSIMFGILALIFISLAREEFETG